MPGALILEDLCLLFLRVESIPALKCRVRGEEKVRSYATIGEVTAALEHSPCPIAHLSRLPQGQDQRSRLKGDDDLRMLFPKNQNTLSGEVIRRVLTRKLHGHPHKEDLPPLVGSCLSPSMPHLPAKIVSQAHLRPPLEVNTTLTQVAIRDNMPLLHFQIWVPHSTPMTKDPHQLPTYPVVPLPDPFVDDRGSILNLFLDGMQSGALITSKAGTRRADHFHLTGNHLCFLLTGRLLYKWRDVGDINGPRQVIITPGKAFYSPSMVEHSMLFLEDSTFLSFDSKVTRDHAGYHADLVKLAEPLE